MHYVVSLFCFWMPQAALDTRQWESVRWTSSKPYHNHMMQRCTNMWHSVIQSCRSKIHHQKRWIVNFIHHAKNKLKVCHVEDCPFCKILLLPADIEIQSPRLPRHQRMEWRLGGRDVNDPRVWICHNRHNTHYAMDASDYLTATAITTARPCHNPSSWRPGAIHQQTAQWPVLYLHKSIYFKKSCFSSDSIFHMQMNTTLTITQYLHPIIGSSVSVAGGATHLS